MKREDFGHYEVANVGAEVVRAFVPPPLPPKPPVALAGASQQLLESAALALGRLDGLVSRLPDRELCVFGLVRKEAVLSSQIEGIPSSLLDLLALELEGASTARPDDLHEVSNYVSAFRHGLRRLGNHFPLSNRLLREVHYELMSSGRGRAKGPGEFRRSQNWIGGSRPGNAVFVPPPHSALPACMTELERFLHAEDDGLSVLLRAGLAHLQFETIHPFLDGNGRVGRILIALQLHDAKLLCEPLLCLSLYFKQHRSDYYFLLDYVRRTGDWERWLAFFLEGVKQTAEDAAYAAQRLNRVFQDDRDRIRASCGRAAGSVLRLHDALKLRPILSLSRASREAKLSFPTTATAMQSLVRQKMAREITGRSRDRLFAHDQYFAILSEGTEPLR
ncbi:MAG: Fic family protein [Bryobacterales bacterium]|nr:Fic family protein [Bryobacterales bacterium]